MTGIIWTEEQRVIIAAARASRNSMMIEADAGCAKTSTLVGLAQAIDPIPALAIAFNKRTATELEQRLPKYFQVKTMNGLGYGAWAAKLGIRKLTVDEYKIRDLLKDLLREQEIEFEDQNDWFKVVELVNSARNAGLIHSSFSTFRGLVPDEEASWEDLYDEPSPKRQLIELAREVLRRSTQKALAGEVDFDEMVYCSVLMGGLYKQFPLIIIDEMQDLNTLNIMQLNMCARDRIIAVGDRKQSIYQFRGAAGDAVEQIRALRKEWLDFPLHITFRCPRVIVARQQGHAPGFTAALQAQEGEYHNWMPEARGGAIEFSGISSEGWTWRWVKSLRQPGEKIWMLSRNNAPLMSMAFKLIKEGVKPEMLGREVGKMLIGQINKITQNDLMEVEPFEELTHRWIKDQCAAAREQKREWLVSGITDRGECILAVCASGRARCVADLKDEIRKLFSDRVGDVTLATIHKSKGLECAVNIHLDPWRIPSKFAFEALEMGNEAPMQQEKNLEYVCETRTRRVFVHANVEDFVNE